MALVIRMAALLGMSAMMAGCSWAAPAAVQTVSTPAQLQAALLAAKGGTEIRIAPGDYGALNLANRSFTGGRLTLIAAGKERPAFTSVDLGKASGITLAGLQLAGPGRPVISLAGASDIVLAGNRIGGATLNGDPWDETGTGMRVRFARHVTIYGNVFEDLQGTAFFQGSDGLIFARNTVQHVREGLNIASTRNLLLERNWFHDFSPKFQNNEHPDSIQFWTARETEGSANVRIVENVMVHGQCGAIQGIFIRSERQTVRHSNFTLQRNVYYGASRHGLTASQIDGLLEENNVVVGSPYSESGARRGSVSDPRCGGALVPSLRGRGSTDVVLRRNAASIIGKTGGKEVENEILGPRGTPYAKFFAARPTGDTPPLSAFLTRPGSAYAKRGVGVLAEFPHGAPADFREVLAAALKAHAEQL